MWFKLSSLLCKLKTLSSNPNPTKKKNVKTKNVTRNKDDKGIKKKKNLHV
jgi:hypothetical protein